MSKALSGSRRCLQATRRVVRLTCMLVLSGCFYTSVAAQSGKIAGTVTDAATGNPLPGVNVVVVGTQQGATTNAQGQYTILNVTPGSHDVRASFVGYAPITKQGVNVNIDLTAEVNFELQEETEQLDEITVQATEPVVKRDISANVANLSAEDVENLPVASVEEVVGMQAGVESGLRVRGSGANQVAMLVDGMSMRGGRSNEPFTGLSYTSIEEVQVQTGGFNAEYGNVRSGLVNIVTKEGPRDHYTADVMMRYRPADEKYFGYLPDDQNAYWIRPYVDPAVAFTGTHSAESPWDRYERDQYPKFEGWNSIAQGLREDNNPNNNLTPEELQQVFNYRHRKDFNIDRPDYTLDGTIGGPVPLVSDALGDLRFTGSFRNTQSTYVVPQMRDAYSDYTGRLKLTSNITGAMKLVLHGLYAKQLGIHPSQSGGTGMFRGEMPNYPWDTRGGILVNNLNDDRRDGQFANNFWNPMDVTRNMVGAKLTHTLGSSTFYDLRLQRMYTDYFIRPGRARDTSIVETIGGMGLTEAPFGWQPAPMADFSGLRLGGHWGKARDSSNVAVWNGRFDLTSQLNQYAQVKTGFEYIISDYHTNHGVYDNFFVSGGKPKFKWNRQPHQGAAYAQTKMEFQGMVANVGLRLDYFHPGGDWYEYGPFTRAFSAEFGYDEMGEVLEQVSTERQFALSPRLGVSFPVTENSKLFFNYGHFRSMLDPADLFLRRQVWTGAIDQIGNPAHPMPKTVAYELGYEQNILDQFLVRMTGYYKKLSNQPRTVRYTSIDRQVDYQISLPKNYANIRGFEVSLRKNRGWVRGFVNYTYMVEKRGNYGFARHFENQVEQRQFERQSRAHYQNRPVPEPYARFNIEFLAPSDFGPQLLGTHLLGDWRASFLGNWRAGQIFTWSGGGGSIIGLENNTSWKDYYNLDLRLAKNFNTGVGDAQFFVDVSNVLNLKRMYRGAAFQGPNDYLKYMQSLHLPEETFEAVGQPPYAFIPGNDEPGDYREEGAPFIPIEIVSNTSDVADPAQRPLYYEQSEEGGTYMWYRNGVFEEADQAFVESVLENKQYINMPNKSYFTFFNPRAVSFGLRLSL